ncbi:C-X-C motif chemokine 10-like [Siniperca chuatsi]|uniref:C-X-C motif chemokine 10-like n=1 Tax=Siniperca chuatsi TaxID=119488 RepID=UPI001CE07E71|nr:C-X-C motif chemokine 10-like [Siniperca chuatsi]
MNSAVSAFLTCLLVLYAQGQLANRSNKCKCLNSYIGRINPQLIKAEPVIHHPSIFCPHTEIIITTTANKEKCVNPQSPLGKLILKNKNKHGKKGALSTTTASSSTRLHTTSKL